MANIKIFVSFLMIIVFFNFFAGGFQISKQSETFEIQKYLIISKIRESIFTDSANNIFTSITKVITAPFLLIDAMIFILVVIGTGISVLPPIVEIFIFSPLSILIIFDYILPMIRGN